MLVTILSILTGLAFVYVLLTLVMGARSMGSKEEAGHQKSNKWMQRRVLGQFVAIGLLFLTFYVKRNAGG
jgi:ABC-type phosphate transport system permease subunit